MPPELAWQQCLLLYYTQLLCSKSVSLKETDFWATELLSENMDLERRKGIKEIPQLALPLSFLLNHFVAGEVCVCMPTHVHAYLPCVSMGTLDFRKHFCFCRNSASE